MSHQSLAISDWTCRHRDAVTELLGSLEYLAECFPQQQALAGIAKQARITLCGDDPVDKASPWLFLLYWNLVRALQADPEGQEVPLAIVLLQHVLRQASLDQDSDRRLFPYASACVSAKRWQVLLENFREEASFPAELSVPNFRTMAAHEAMYERALSVISEFDPHWALLLNFLQRLVIVAEPAISQRGAQSFGGATSFFFWRGTLINANCFASLPGLLEQLVHECCHGALFIRCKEGRLCENSDEQRIKVAIRPDPRPMNGILHSYVVAANVSSFMERLTSSHSSFGLRHAEWQSCCDIANRNRQNARSSLEAIHTHGRLTTLGRDVVSQPLLLNG